MGKKLGCVLRLVLVLAAPAIAADPPGPPGGAWAPTSRVLDLRVVERDGETPVAGVAIASLPGRKDEPEFRGATDEQGRCSVPVPSDVEKTHHFAVRAWKDGFVPVRVLWGYTRSFEFEGVPASYTVILDRGTPIGGIVRDEQGRPIAGARVFPTFISGRRSEMEWVDLPSDVSFTTDAQGRWRCAILPASWNTGGMGFDIKHPHFVCIGRYRNWFVSIKDLRAQTAVMLMQTGFTLRGTVTDQDGRPIAGMTVVWASAYEGDGQLRVKTGADGRFQFENRPPGISLVAAEAPGRATNAKQVDLGPDNPNDGAPPFLAGPSSPGDPKLPSGYVETDEKPPAVVPAPPTGGPRPPARVVSMAPNASVVSGFLPHNAKQLRKDGPCEPPLVLRLGPGRTIRGRVVDTKGRPIAGARVAPEFRGRPGLLGWQAETDADGRFQWTNAPNEVVVLKVDNPAEGQVVRRFGPGARDGEIVVTMPAPFRLRGKVVDAETGQPIERFRLIEGLVWTHDLASDDERRPVWTGQGDTIVGGNYEIRFPQRDLSRETPDEYALLVVRIEAEGYAPATSTEYWVGVGEQTWDFALRKRPWIKGTVRAPDGSPAAGAEAVVAMKGQPVPWIYNGRLAPGWTGDVVRTGPDGRYAFAKPDAAGRVVIVGDRGLAQRTVDELAAEPDVTLEPWGRIRGQLRGRPGVGARRLVAVFGAEPDFRGEPVVTFSGRTLTDAEGHFVLDRVAPGHAMVYRPHWLSDGTILRSHRQGVEAASGQTVEVIVGGTGRPVVGRLARAAGLPTFDLTHVRGRLRFVQPSPEFPDGFGEWDEKRQREWWDAFYRTEEGRRYGEQGSSYAVNVHPDGSFCVDDVPMGRYRLVFEYEMQPDGFDADPQEGPTRVAELRVDLDVPPGPDEKPMDLGALTLMAPERGVVDR